MSDASHDVSFHSMHKIMCLAVCRRSLIDFIAVMKENLLRSGTCTYCCEFCLFCFLMMRLLIITVMYLANIRLINISKLMAKGTV